ncbi:MAG: hypothetical protein JNL79_05085 [Myxococcales bacterium]|nr:hypothetical protein [Myxococcales bacterium]
MSRSVGSPSGWLLGSVALFVTLTTGCAAPEDVAPSPSDTGGDGAADTGADAKVDGADAGPECTTGGTDVRGCGRCGKQKRTCVSGKWAAWGSCADEVEGAECSLGEKRTTDCGNCGKSNDTCDTTTCTWNVGACTGEGECAPGTEETSTASCTTAGEIRTRTCDDKCKFSAYSDCAAPKGWLTTSDPPSGFEPRYGAVTVFDGTRPIVWGGAAVDFFGDTTALGDGATYDIGADKWTLLPSGGPGGRAFACGVFGKGKMIVWGGVAGGSATSFSLQADGALYDPATKTWSTMTTTGAPSARFSPGCVWSSTTSEMIVWGGCTTIDSTGSCTTWAADGGAYDPVKNTWTALPTAPGGFAARAAHSMVWSGTEALIWGGGTDLAEYKDGLRYEPVAKTWTTLPAAPSGLVGRLGHASVFTDKELFVYGGAELSSGTALGDGARYLPGGSWTLVATPSSSTFASPERYLPTSWYGAGKVWVWSGLDSSFSMTKGGASYEIATGTWAAMPTTGEPTPRAFPAFVWTGKEAFLFSGIDYDFSETLKGGAIFRP